MTAAIIYGLCALTGLVCAWLLFSAYQTSKYRMLMWGSFCFSGLTLSNALLVIDKVFLPNTVDLATWRYAMSLVSMMILLYGLIWETE